MDEEKLGIGKTSNKELALFLIINFSFVILMGIFMTISKSKVEFVLTQMLYPACAVMITLMITREHEDLPMKFFKTFIYITIVNMVFLLIEFIILNKEIGIANIVSLASNFILLYSFLYDEKIKDLNMNIFKFDGSLKYIIIFVLSMFLRVIISSIMIKESIWLNLKPLLTKEYLSYYILMPILFIPNMFYMFGEEYGWRFFLQPALQDRLGKKIGVLITGALWGFWHFPININFYNPHTPIKSIISYIITCALFSIFLGFVYMKTNNIWTLSFIHFINNGLFTRNIDLEKTQKPLSNKDIIYFTLLYLIIYGIFILSREYKDSNRKPILK